MKVPFLASITLLVLFPLLRVPAQEEDSEEILQIEIKADDPLLRQLEARFPRLLTEAPNRFSITVDRTLPPRGPATMQAAVPPNLGALANYNGKAGRTDNNAHLITRAGNQPALRIVALSPGDEGTSVHAKPVLWWHQSGPSANAELEFILTKLGGRRPEELLRVPLRPMPGGFNSLSLANPALNPEGLELAPGIPYQWTISVRGEDTNAAVFATLQRTENKTLAEAVTEAPLDPETLNSLSASGNWYELFDVVSRLARRHPEDDNATSARDALVKQAGLNLHQTE